MSKTIKQPIKVDHALNYQALSSNTAVSIYFPMANYDRIQFIVDQLDGSATNVQIRQSLDNTNTNSTTISTVSNVNLTAVNTCNTIEVRASELDTANAYCYVGILVAGVSTTANVVAVAVRTPARYPQATMLS